MTEDEGVGYMKPPKKHQFKPGQSGNPRGRKKKYKSPVSILAAPIRMKVGGQVKEISSYEASFRKTAQAATEGHLRETKRFFKACDEAGLLGTEEALPGGFVFSEIPESVLTDPRLTDQERAELHHLNRTRNDCRKQQRKKSGKDRIVEQVALEKHFVAKKGGKMSVLDVVQYKLQYRALIERDPPCHAYFEELLTKTTVDIGDVKLGVIVVPVTLPESVWIKFANDNNEAKLAALQERDAAFEARRQKNRADV